MTHELKTWNEYFEAIFTGNKTFEIRKNNRGFKNGDTLILKEWDPKTEKYTGRQVSKTVTYLLDGGKFGLEIGFVAMAIE